MEFNEWLKQGFRQNDEHWVAAVIQHFEWLEAQERRGVIIDDQPRDVRWEAPPQGVIKLNVDAGWTGSSSTGFGLVARSGRGEFMTAATKLEHNRLDSLLAEAYAVRWGLQMAAEMEMENVVIESDSLPIANGVAHELAAIACDFPFHVWWHDPPPVVAHALFVDATFLD
ncbi:uncharacterized protein LOC130736197 [Lotus japonicus]|uniref:uncharacterized protein LOC130736197 n=1 Tax=Lotus japonicus TaxID=34305 RepID=UPI00258F5B03|nr:uncharacterized protein LOC130736197 [Lotus japonicus]